MFSRIVLASGSEIRRRMLTNAGLNVTVRKPSVDESSIRAVLAAKNTSPADVANALAEAKARSASAREGASLVIGCDQILAFDGRILAKPESREHALSQLSQLSGQWHDLFSAAVVCRAEEPAWRHVGHVRLKMRHLSEHFLANYVDRNWDSIRQSVGGYKLEEEGVRLFHRIEGDYFNVLGLPLLELLNFLTERGAIRG